MTPNLHRRKQKEGGQQGDPCSARDDHQRVRTDVGTYDGAGGHCKHEDSVCTQALEASVAAVTRKPDKHGRQADRERQTAVMGAIASALSARDSADVAAYFAGRGNGLAPVAGEPLPRGGRSARQPDPATRLVFAGDPQRGIPPCAACHGPGGHKLGAPSLQGQHAAYLERQLAAFAQGVRRNDIDQQMRVIAEQLAPEEVDAVSAFYSSGKSGRANKRFLRAAGRRLPI